MVVCSQPDHGLSHLRHPTALSKGVFLVKKGIHSDGIGYTSLGIQQNSNGALVIELRRPDGVSVFPSLADCGVLPYKDGSWNQNNWLERFLAIVKPERIPTVGVNCPSCKYWFQLEVGVKVGG
jgi:hypothetical protein